MLLCDTHTCIALCAYTHTTCIHRKARSCSGNMNSTAPTQHNTNTTNTQTCSLAANLLSAGWKTPPPFSDAPSCESVMQTDRHPGRALLPCATPMHKSLDQHACGGMQGDGVILSRGCQGRHRAAGVHHGGPLLHLHEQEEQPPADQGGGRPQICGVRCSGGHPSHCRLAYRERSCR